MDQNRTISMLQEKDIAAIVKLEKKNFTDPWSENIIRDSLNQPRNMAAGIFINNELVGYYFSRLVLDEGELMNLCVDKSFRRQGMGLALLHHMEERLKNERVKCIYLEVRKKNISAQNLYLSDGYKKTGLRSAYYGDDDAVLMMKKLTV